MAPSDETRSDPRSSLFGRDEGVAEDTQVVDNPYPPAQRPSRRPPVHPPDPQGGRGIGGGPYGAAPGGPGQSWGGGFDDGYGHPQPDPYGGDGGGDRFDGPGGARTGGGPTILANQAGEWERNFHEAEVVRSRRTGIVLLFLLALVVVIVAAIGLAAWSVFGGGDDADDATIDSGLTTTVPDPNAAPGSDDVAGAESTVPEVTPVDPNALQVSLLEDPFVCDGETREFATIAGADPNESIAFTSPQVESLRSGQADANGELPIRWSCTPEQAGTTWELTATGETSQRSATFIFAGVIDDGGAATDPAPEGELAVEVIEDPFVCDGTTRVFASLSGAEPNESVAFTSPQSPNLSSGQAGVDGSLPMRWNCDPEQAGTVWDLTATGETSGRSVTFSFTGAPPSG